jgi:hypothetical protein
MEALGREIERDPKIWHRLFRAVLSHHGRTLRCLDCEAPLSTVPLECPDCGSQAFVLEAAADSAKPPILIRIVDGVFRWWALHEDGEEGSYH